MLLSCSSIYLSISLPIVSLRCHIKDEIEEVAIRNRSLFTHPPDNWLEWGLKDFELHCIPYRNLVHRIGIKLTASSISERHEHGDLQFQDLGLDLLLEILKSADLIDDASPSNLTYKAEDSQLMGIKVAENCCLLTEEQFAFTYAFEDGYRHRRMGANTIGSRPAHEET